MGLFLLFWKSREAFLTIEPLFLLFFSNDIGFIFVTTVRTVHLFGGVLVCLFGSVLVCLFGSVFVLLFGGLLVCLFGGVFVLLFGGVLVYFFGNVLVHLCSGVLLVHLDPQLRLDEHLVKVILTLVEPGKEVKLSYSFSL